MAAKAADSKDVSPIRSMATCYHSLIFVEALLAVRVAYLMSNLNQTPIKGLFTTALFFFRSSSRTSPLQSSCRSFHIGLVGSSRPAHNVVFFFS